MVEAIPYTHYNYFIVQAYYSLDSISGKVVFDFHEYVKSQVHYNVTHDLFNRELKTYVDAYKAITAPNPEITSDVMLVLGYFYQDIANIVLQSVNKNGECNFDFDISVRLNGLTEYTADLNEVRQNVTDALNLVKPKSKGSIFGINFIRGLQSNRRSTLQVTDVFCKATALHHLSKAPVIIKWR